MIEIKLGGAKVVDATVDVQAPITRAVMDVLDSSTAEVVYTVDTDVIGTAEILQGGPPTAKIRFYLRPENLTKHRYWYRVTLYNLSTPYRSPDLCGILSVIP